MSFGIPVRNGLAVGLLASTTLSAARNSPRLNLDFLNMAALPSTVTFTRGTTATFVGSNGLIQTAAINTPRFDYDPVTLAPKGLLIEEQRTNLLTYSEQFDNAAWAKSGATVTANAATAPDGNVSADAMVESATNSTHTILQTPAVSASTTYTWTVYAKRETGNRNLYLQANINGGTFGAGFAWFDLGTGVAAAPATLTAPFTGVSSSMTPVGAGWYRCSFTFTTNAGNTSVNCYTAIYNGGRIYSGDGSSSVLLWGAQFEAGAFATSYIPTVASQVTRSADVATMTGANFSSWYNQSEGTFVAAFDTTWIGNSDVTRYALGFDGSGSKRLIYISSGTTAASNYDGTNILAAVGTIIPGPSKVASAYGGTTKQIVSNGGTVASGAFAGWASPTTLNLGSLGGTANGLCGHIRSITYYPTRLSNAQLQALTA